MAGRGHRRVTNFGAKKTLRDPRLRLETGAPPRTNKSSLPYYRPPSRPETMVDESAVMYGSTAVPVPSVVLSDAAVGSFGETAVLEAIIGNDDRVRVDNGYLRVNPWRQI